MWIEGFFMDSMEMMIMGLIATCKEFQMKILFIGMSLFVIGLLIGFLISFMMISQPLSDAYNKQYAKLTNNDTLKCFNVTNLYDPIVLDRLEIDAYCKFIQEKPLFNNSFIGVK